MTAAVEPTKQSPMSDQTNKKPQAWKGTNPITQRPSNPTTPVPNGVAAAAKPVGPPPAKQNVAPKTESRTADKHANDRLSFLLANFIGMFCEVTVRNGDVYTGIFSGGSPDTPDSRYVLKMTKLKTSLESQSQQLADGLDEYIGQGQDHVMTFECQDVVDLHVADVALGTSKPKAQTATSSFRTDTDISGNSAARERTLQKWDASGDASADMSLDASSGAATWDQFETNERLYNLKSDYDENMYTTTIDRTHPEYRARKERAERIAREIERSSAMNAHVAEERGLKVADDSGLDEEDKYSGVQRNVAPLPTDNPNRYTPPARRPPTGQPTVPGAPVDPAIIHSQLAKPARPTPPVEPIGSKAAPTPSNAEERADAGGDGNAHTAASAAPAKQEVPTEPVPAKSTTEATKKVDGNATDTVEHDVMEAFKLFATTEKNRVQTQQRQRSHQEKQMKINDLKKFAQNFKLNTPVPTDLVPILAKDEKKQKEIVDKAKEAAESVKVTPKAAPPVAAPLTESKSQRSTSHQPVAPSVHDRVPPQTQPRRQNQGNTYSNYGPRVPGQNSGPRNGPGHLGSRLYQNQQQNRAGGYYPQPIHQPSPINIPNQPSVGAMGGITSPGPASRFNGGAVAFRPSATAAVFSPGSVSQGEGSTISRESSTRGPSDFWDGRPPPAAADHPSLEGLCDPIQRMLRETAADPAKQKQYQNNGGIPEAYRTPPGWDVAEANRDLTYEAVFNCAPPFTSSAIASSTHAIIPTGHMPHQHQLPPHLQQNGSLSSQGSTPHQTPRHMQAQPHSGPVGPGNYDDHRMQYSHSSSSQHNPRHMVPHMAGYGQPGPYQAMAMPGYAFTQNGQQFQTNAAMRNAYPAPGGHMMVPNPSGGSYMQAQHQMPGFSQSPGQAHVYPHGGVVMQGPNGAHAGPNSFPSPRIGAPTMQPQGSQQSHNGVSALPQGAQPFYYMTNMHPQAILNQQGGHMTPMRAPYPGYAIQGPYGTSPGQHSSFQPHQPNRGTPSAQYAPSMMSQPSMGGMVPAQQQPAPPQQTQLQHGQAQSSQNSTAVAGAGPVVEDSK